MKYPSTQQLAERKAWALEQWAKHPLCMCCGRRVAWPYQPNCWLAAEVHHIAFKGRAPKRYEERCNYLLMCARRGNKPGCHPWLHSIDKPSQPIESVLAMKAICDPTHFDLTAWLALQPDLNPERITLHQVNEAANELRWLHALFTEREPGE